MEFSVSGQEKIEATELLFFLKQDLLREKRLLNHASLGNKDNKENTADFSFFLYRKINSSSVRFPLFCGIWLL